MSYVEIHPYTIDVYLITEDLYSFSEALDGYDWVDEDAPEELIEELEHQAARFAFLEERAIAVVGSRAELTAQLLLLNSRRGTA